MLRGVDARELDNFLVSRGASPVCCACGHDEWAQVGLDPGYRLRLTGEAPDGTQFLGIVVIAIACQNCAALRLHALDVMEGNLEKVAPDSPD